MDTVLGLLELALYMCTILAISAAVTFAVIKFPSIKKKPKSADG